MKNMPTKVALAATMAAHHAAFMATAAAAPAGAYEKRDAPTITSVAEAIDKIATAFDQYKKTNDERLEAVKKGQATGDFEAKLAKIDKDMNDLTEVKERLEKIDLKLARPGAFSGGSGGQKQLSKGEQAYKNAFMAWVRNPKDVKAQGELQLRASELEVEQRSVDPNDLETRATQTVVGTPGAGGYALPKVIEDQIARLSVDISPIRQIATVRQVSTTDYHELFDLGGAAFEWVGEGDTRNQTNTPDLADVQPTFGMASAKPQASEESLMDLFFNVDSWLTMSAAEALSLGEGAAFISGNGVKKPTGILAGPTPVATADASRAFGTLQYLASGAAAALPGTPDAFIDMAYSVRARYRANARWLMAKLTLAALRKYKDSTGQYLWQPALTAGQPATFMGYPITEAEDMPAVAAGAFPIAFGDFKEGYLIADLVGMRITRDEVTSPGQVKFYVRRRVGGKLRNTQAIKLMKIATS